MMQSFFMSTTKALIRLNGFESLRKHDYSNILKILPPKNENFQIKNSDIFFTFLLKTWIVGTR